MTSNSLRIRLRIERAGSPPRYWYSARLRFAILTDRQGLERYLDSVILLRAVSRENAFALALEQGRQREQSYRNNDGLGVRWRLASVVSLDEIAGENLNGTEILSMPVEPEEPSQFDWDHEFQPERSVPAETRA